MMQRLMNSMRAQAELAQSGRARVRVGLVSSYDPANYCAKVRLMPEDVETGWLPVTSPWAGNGWGMFAPPTPGDMVEVQFQEDSIEAGFVVGRFYSDSDRPLPAPSGEFWLVHQSGSLLKFHNGGTVELVAAGTLTSSAPQWNHTGPVHITGDTTVTGNIVATGDISDHTNKSMAGMRAVYNGHSHPGDSGGTTGTPNQGM